MQTFLSKISRLNFALILLFIGIIIRFFYMLEHNVLLFQHDWHGHIEYIKYMATNWDIPLAGKALQFPQQPLYYIISGAIYKYSLLFGWDEPQALRNIGIFSFLSSIVFLIYGYKVLALLGETKTFKAMGMIFLALTPSLVYMSARINNDALVMGLSALTLYYFIKAYQAQFKHYFYLSLLLVTLLFLTKVTTASFELLLFALLLHTYVKSSNPKILKQRLYIFGLLGVFLLGWTLLRLYLPLSETLHMVNSGRYPNQTIEHLDWNYWGTFNFSELLSKGFSYVFGLNSIRYSFFTYQYGTMIFGEFDYAYFIGKNGFLLTIMQSMIKLNLIYPLAFVAFILTLYKKSTLKILLFGAVTINFLLVLKFMLEFSSVCNTDFRYYASSFVIFAFIFAEGVRVLSFNEWSKIFLNTILVFLATLELAYFVVFLII